MAKKAYREYTEEEQKHVEKVAGDRIGRKPKPEKGESTADWKKRFDEWVTKPVAVKQSPAMKKVSKLMGKLTFAELVEVAAMAEAAKPEAANKLLEAKKAEVEVAKKTAAALEAEVAAMEKSAKKK